MLVSTRNENRIVSNNFEFNFNWDELKKFIIVSLSSSQCNFAVQYCIICLSSSIKSLRIQNQKFNPQKTWKKNLKIKYSNKLKKNHQQHKVNKCLQGYINNYLQMNK